MFRVGENKNTVNSENIKACNDDVQRINYLINDLVSDGRRRHCWAVITVINLNRIHLTILP